jgi:hemerythrin superfamily protein
MIVIHNIVIRTMNAVYIQSENVTNPKDVADFLEYCAVWVSFLHSHHNEEEKYVFPDIEKLAGVPGLMAGNVEQHAAFHGGVDAFGAYVDSVKSGKEKYDGAKIKEHVDAFMPALYKHLQEEISTLKGLKKFDKVDWKKFWDETSARIIKKQQSDPTSAVCEPLRMPVSSTANCWL